MKKIKIHMNERGLLFVKGEFKKILLPGEYRQGKYEGIVTLQADCQIGDDFSPGRLIKYQEFADCVENHTIMDNEIGLVYLDNRPKMVIQTGDNYFFKDEGRLKVVRFDRTDLEAKDLTAGQLEVFGRLVARFTVNVGHQGILLVNGAYVKTLEPGTHLYWRIEGQPVECNIYDLRVQELDISGQEILTADKVAVRVNASIAYKVLDPVAIHNELKRYQEHLYSLAQLAIREHIGQYTFDELLDQKQLISAGIAEALKAKAQAIYTEVISGGILDIVLPGEIRTIMNKVLIAKKNAEANVITRREETASTRSLLNTAKLLDENATLYKLKELEYIERIAEKVRSISLGGGDILSELKNVVIGK